MREQLFACNVVTQEAFKQRHLVSEDAFVT